LLIVARNLVDSLDNLLDQFHGVLLCEASNKHTTAKVGSEFDNVSLLEPNLRSMLVGKFALKELLRKTTFHIEALILSKFLGDVRKDLSEPGSGKELRDDVGVGLELIWQPRDHSLLQRDDFIGVEEANQLIIY